MRKFLIFILCFIVSVSNAAGCLKTDILSELRITENAVNPQNGNDAVPPQTDLPLEDEVKPATLPIDDEQADESTETANVELIYELTDDGNGYVVKGFNGTETEITVPATYNGKPITKIAEKAFENCNLTAIEIGNNVEEIGSSAFSRSKLKRVVIPDKVTAIAQSTFYLCVNLEEITLPKNLTYIDCDAFGFCRKLKTVRFKGTTDEWNNIIVEDGLNSDIEIICSG